MKHKLSGILVIILIVLGSGLLLYPVLSQWYNQKYQMNAIEDYDASVSAMRADQIREERINAEAYNAALTGADIEDPFIPGSGAVLPDNYISVLDVHNGIMGYIEIPVIEVSLPIYHGTSDEVLEKGAGHMEMTAFPIGGTGNHAVLTGHTGLPDSRLFTDLTEMRTGDLFLIHVLDETLAYEVDQILVVDPSDTEALRPAEDKDYITLVTCTPYAINSHRLLVRGARTDYNPEEQVTSNTDRQLPYGRIIAVLAAGVVLTGIYRSRRMRKQAGAD